MASALLYVALMETTIEPTQSAWARVRSFMRIIDERYEDLDRSNWKKTVYQDFSAGLVVAMTAIPMAMGFAIAMGMRPEQGIIAGAVSCLVGRTFGGSKYQVYGPTAAFIPVIAGVIYKYGEAGGGTFAQAHGLLVAVSIVAGLLLMLFGVLGFGKYGRLVPPSIIVGFTVGIAAAIALSNIGDALGFRSALSGSMGDKLASIASRASEISGWAVLLAGLTFGITKVLIRISIFIPGPLVALGVCTALSSTVLSGRGIVLVRDRFGAIPNNFFVFTPPSLPAVTTGLLLDCAYYVVAIVFVSGVESVLCSSMADRLAGNKKTPFNPNREFWGQGLVQIITPLINGFPCTGALARTATSIKCGAQTPLAGYFKAIIKLTAAYFLAAQLGFIPLACIAGILLWVASNMVKKHEIQEVLATGRFHTALMIYTAIMVPMTDFLTGVLSALILYAGYMAWRRYAKNTAPAAGGIEAINGEVASVE